MTKVKLVKLREYEGALYPNNIKTGHEVIGYIENYPKVGESFEVYYDGTKVFSTSLVQEIIDDNTFRTYNSIYQFTILQKIV